MEELLAQCGASVASGRELEHGYQIKTTDKVSVTLYTSGRLVFQGGSQSSVEGLVARWDRHAFSPKPVRQ